MSFFFFYNWNCIFIVGILSLTLDCLFYLEFHLQNFCVTSFTAGILLLMSLRDFMTRISFFSCIYVIHFVARIFVLGVPSDFFYR